MATFLLHILTEVKIYAIALCLYTVAIFCGLLVIVRSEKYLINNLSYLDPDDLSRHIGIYMQERTHCSMHR